VHILDDLQDVTACCNLTELLASVTSAVLQLWLSAMALCSLVALSSVHNIPPDPPPRLAATGNTANAIAQAIAQAQSAGTTNSLGNALGQAVNQGGSSTAQAVAQAFAQAIAQGQTQAVASAIAQAAAQGNAKAIASALAQAYASGSGNATAVAQAIAQAYTQVRHWQALFLCASHACSVQPQHCASSVRINAPCYRVREIEIVMCLISVVQQAPARDCEECIRWHITLVMFAAWLSLPGAVLLALCAPCVLYVATLTMRLAGVAMHMHIAEMIFRNLPNLFLYAAATSASGQRSGAGHHRGPQQQLHGSRRTGYRLRIHRRRRPSLGLRSRPGQHRQRRELQRHRHCSHT
jgi:hypothetical protein